MSETNSVQKVLVTGAGGYIGSVLTRVLLEAGLEVTAVDRFHFGEETLPADDRLTVVSDDIRTLDPAALKGQDALIDLAAMSNDPSGELNPVSTISINHLGRLRMAVLAKSMGVGRYILPSSCSVYGFQDGLIDESAEVNPLTTYAWCNYRAEQDIGRLNGDGFAAIIIRQATVYGASPRMRFDLAINGMVRGFLQNGKIPILKDGEQWRPFVHVADTSKAMLMILKAPVEQVAGEVFNVGCNEQNYQIFPMAETVAKALDQPFEFEWYGDPDHRSYRVDFAKIQETLGFEPDYDAFRGAKEVADGIRDGKLDPEDPRTITLKWYQKLIDDGVEI